MVLAHNAVEVAIVRIRIESYSPRPQLFGDTFVTSLGWNRILIWTLFHDLLPRPAKLLYIASTAVECVVISGTCPSSD